MYFLYSQTFQSTGHPGEVNFGKFIQSGKILDIVQ